MENCKPFYGNFWDKFFVDNINLDEGESCAILIKQMYQCLLSIRWWDEPPASTVTEAVNNITSLSSAMMINGRQYLIQTLSMIFWVEMWKCSYWNHVKCYLYLNRKAELLGLHWHRRSKGNVLVTNMVTCPILIGHLLMGYNLVTCLFRTEDNKITIYHFNYFKGNNRLTNFWQFNPNLCAWFKKQNKQTKPTQQKKKKMPPSLVLG